MYLAAAIQRAAAAGDALAAAIAAGDPTAAAPLIEERQKALNALREALDGADAAERSTCRAAWDVLVAADRRLQATAATARDVLGDAVAARPAHAGAGNPYCSPAPTCYDRQA
ncbi:MAG: hypothetical protein R6X25_08890 [Candidatus Krumholzibacteriia bacterium]